MWGKSPYTHSAAISNCSQTRRKDSSGQGGLKFKAVSNSFLEGTRREKTHLKKVTNLPTLYLLSQAVRTKYDARVVYTVLPKSLNYAIGKKRCRFCWPSIFWCIPSESR